MIFINQLLYVYILDIHNFGCHELEGKTTMNKLLVALGLAATVALVGCNKDKAPETGATTGEHLENAAQQASADIKSAGDQAASDIATATDNASAKIDAAADHAADATAKAAARTEATARKATADTAQAVENAAADVKKRCSTLIRFSN